LDQYLQDSPLRSLVCYLHAAEMGYEVSQSNAAFIIRRKVKGVVSIPDITIYQPLGRGQVVPREVYVRRYLEARELAMSAFHGNRESSVNIGNLLFEEASKAVATVSGRMRTSKQPATFQTLVNQFFSTSGGRGATGDRRGRVQDVSYGDTSAAVWWYSKASAAGSAMGSMYVGTMHHFGTGVPKNPHRAIRYYDEALRLHSSGADQLQPSILSVTQMLRWLAATSIGASTSSAPTSNYIQWPFSASSIARPFASTVEWAVYYIWRRYYG
jgi:TPR repeat protein